MHTILHDLHTFMGYIGVRAPSSAHDVACLAHKNVGLVVNLTGACGALHTTYNRSAEHPYEWGTQTDCGIEVIHIPVIGTCVSRVHASMSC
jgi:hypothetical protein